MKNDDTKRKLLGKVEFSGKLNCLTGLHIGSSRESLEIGSLDSPVIRDPVTDHPYIPGSSLKGKLRGLLEKAYVDLPFNRNGGTASNPIWRHECGDWEPSNDGSKGALHCPVCRLFGSTGPGQGNRNYPARVKVRDLYLTEDSQGELQKIETGLNMTEWKFENSIDRVTSAANPRNIERVPKGAEFEFSIVYDVEDLDTMKEDLENLQLAIRLLEDDALGGHGSRGYGRVKFGYKKVEARKLDYYKGNENGSVAFSGLNEQSIAQMQSFFTQQGGGQG